METAAERLAEELESLTNLEKCYEDRRPFPCPAWK